MIAALLLALALAMDAFAVALTQGARFRPGMAGGLAIALTFGIFQAVMPLAGWGIGANAFAYVEAVDHWIAFGLLVFLGVRMLGGHVGEEEAAHALTGRALLVAGVATSVDALAAGITLPTLDVAPLLAVALIGGVTFALSGVGVLLGRIAGDRWGAWAERAGGIILIALGCKILAEHTGWLAV
ncbi:manganese efflux pump MntP family protein [Erythrobacter dokdonensis]|uniref:Putative manganese efflux pump MntP n=1 Tax=Erythrobacter dokdonensis DSW-74 TaxID=1300349 RepID=A0A1A7BGL9_9SPHN|nr:manganese efflux pump MntP family protein [Erythrobacter dokdonensis]OBV10350.1 putative manganese efflux pump [Erythrobacter dokdonensis DSW-74]